MAPKQRVVVHASSRQQRGFVSSAWNEITSPDNSTVVRSVLIFGAAVAFLHSSLSELLLPPYRTIKASNAS